MNTQTIPEGCKLVAAHTGDGWILEIHDSENQAIGLLAWPKSWPESVTTEQLEAYGFEVV
jgi:anthranilate/para-aminobenzoate synthase component II